MVGCLITYADIQPVLGITSAVTCCVKLIHSVEVLKCCFKLEEFKITFENLPKFSKIKPFEEFLLCLNEHMATVLVNNFNSWHTSHYSLLIPLL